MKIQQKMNLKTDLLLTYLWGMPMLLEPALSKNMRFYNG